MLLYSAVNFANDNDLQEYKKWFTSNIHIHIHITYVLLTRTRIDTHRSLKFREKRKLIFVLRCNWCEIENNLIKREVSQLTSQNTLIDVI